MQGIYNYIPETNHVARVYNHHHSHIIIKFVFFFLVPGVAVVLR